MKFVKMHGLGNDFLIFDCLENGDSEHAPVWLTAERVQQLCDRHCGIGSDGLICVLPSTVADFRMLICNADGSRAQMCGNGIRCVGKYVSDHGKTEQENLRIETDAGVRQLRLDKGTDRVAVTAVRVDMGTPEFVPEHISARFLLFRPVCVSMGNPHAIVYLDKNVDLKAFELEKIGPMFENHPAFPDRVNTEFIQVCDSENLNMRVWERGSGETFACGTGACASLVATVLNGLCNDTATLHLLGGDLKITWDKKENTVYMEGPAETVFTGEWLLKEEN